MQHHRRTLLAFATASLLVALPARAQEKATELTAGIVGLSSTSSGGRTLFQLATGGAYFAAGFYLSPGAAIEPTITSIHQSSNGYSVTTLGIVVAAPIYLDKTWGRTGIYVAPRAGFNYYSCSQCTGQTQMIVGAAVGAKMRLNDLAALRVQGGFDYGFASGDFDSSTILGASLGLSVFVP